MYIPYIYFFSMAGVWSQKKYRNLIAKDKCVQIFTYDAALPYLLKKPTCNKYYFIWSIGSIKNQNLYVDSINNKQSNFILTYVDTNNSFNSEIPGFLPPPISLPIIHDFIKKNYQLHENLLYWNFYKSKS